MIKNKLRINLFFFLSLIFHWNSYALDPPSVKVRPEIKVYAYQDVFDQIKKQNWAMAIVLADDYKNENLSSYIRWLDITRPGSNHKFQYLTNFYKNHKHWPKNEILIRKIESSIESKTEPEEIIEWYQNNPPQTSKGKIDYLENLIKVGKITEKKKKN